jgi:hypothetical protein
MAIKIFIEAWGIGPIRIKNHLKIIEIKRKNSFDDEQKLGKIPQTCNFIKSQKQIVLKVKAIEIEVTIKEGKRNELYPI